jgi:hypothetical protein
VCIDLAFFPSLTPYPFQRKLSRLQLQMGETVGRLISLSSERKDVERDFTSFMDVAGPEYVGSCPRFSLS